MGKLSPKLGIWESKRGFFDLKKDQMDQKWEFGSRKGKLGSKKWNLRSEWEIWAQKRRITTKKWEMMGEKREIQPQKRGYWV